MQNTTRKILAFGLAALLCCLVFAAPAYAAKRVALVIGNNAYENVPALQKAVNDSEARSRKSSPSSASTWSRPRMSGAAP